MADSAIWQVVWVLIGVFVFVAGVRSGKSRRAMYVARTAVAVLFIVAGALFNSLNLATGGDYKGFADDSYIPFVRDTWRSLVAPNEYVFITLLIAFEVAVGLLVLAGGRKTQLGLVGAIGFHLGLMCFGWFYYAWSIPMILVFTLLLRAERKQAVSAAADGQAGSRLAA